MVIDGGMTMPTTPLEATTPVAQSREYPFFSISLTIVVPSAAVVAADDPEMAAKKQPETETVCARPPVNEPTSACEN